ncbi:unnamed protein product, partial [Aphanomyces euteiches]
DAVTLSVPIHGDVLTTEDAIDVKHICADVKPTPGNSVRAMAGNANAPWTDASFVLESVASVQGMASSVEQKNVVNPTAIN